MYKGYIYTIYLTFLSVYDIIFSTILQERRKTMKSIPKTIDILDCSHTMAAPLLSECEYPYEALPKIKEFIKSCFDRLDDTYEKISEDVYIAKDAKVWPNTTIVGPTIIGHRTEVRPGAFIRGSVLVGDDAVIGNSTELKNCIVFDKAQLPHYNYVGDSIIGYKGHLGAGAIASNLRLDRENIKIDGETLDIKKMGVCLGDLAEVGCGTVICPGTIIGRETLVYPVVTVKGVIPEKKIFDGHRLKDRR
jgi:UDP-3-O-[3-hydroxymyristoyl] glucosamine N-acyltransferase